jgi:hypothetical protein
LALGILVLLILAGILLIISNYSYVPDKYIEDNTLNNGDSNGSFEFDNLSIELNLDKDNYTIGETITASIKILNNNESNVTSNLVFDIMSYDLGKMVKTTESQWIVMFYDEILVTVDAYSEKTVIKNYDIPMDVSTEFLFTSDVSFANKVDSKVFDVKPLFDVVVDFPKDVDIYEIFNVSLEIINNCDEGINNITVDFKVLKGHIVESFMETIDSLFGNSSAIFNWSLFLEDDDWYKLRFDVDSDNGGNDVLIHSMEVWDFNQIVIDLVSLSDLYVAKGSIFNVSSIIVNYGYKPLYNVEIELKIPPNSGLNTTDSFIKNINNLHPEIHEIVNWTFNSSKTGNYLIWITVIDESKKYFQEDGVLIQVVDELSY